MRHDHADRPGDTGRLGEDRVGLVPDGHRHVITAAGRDAPHADDDGDLLLFRQFAEVMVKVVAAADAAAGAIDAEDHGLDVLVFHGRVDRPLDEAVLAFLDDALDRQDDDLVLPRSGRARRTSPAPAECVPEQTAAHGEQNEIQEKRPADHQHEKREEQSPPESSAGGWRRRIVEGAPGRSRLGCNGRLRWRCPFGMGGSRHGIPRGPSVYLHVLDVFKTRAICEFQGTTPFYRVFPIKQCPGTVQVRPAGMDLCVSPTAKFSVLRQIVAHRVLSGRKDLLADGVATEAHLAVSYTSLVELFVAKGAWACLLLLVPDVLPTCPWIPLCSGWSTWNTPVWKSPFTRPTGT